MPVATAMNSRKPKGIGVKPISFPSEEKGSTKPKSTTESVVTVNARLGLLRKGLRAVRMTKITSVWVAKDSTNQPL